MNLKNTMRAAAAATLAVTALGLALPTQAQDTWRMRHHDNARQGRASGAGDITVPAIKWRHSIGDAVPGASVLIKDVNGDEALEYVSLFNGALVARDFSDNVLWDTRPLGVNRFEALGDFNGDGLDEILLLGTLGAIVDGATGQVLWRLTPDDPAQLTFRTAFTIAVNVDDDPELELLAGAAGNATQRFVRLYDFSGGFDNVETVWTNTDANLAPSVLRMVVGDFDGDGQDKELALVNQTFCRAVFINIEDGTTLRTTGNLTGGRYCYGLTEAANVDGDPQDELVFTGAAGNGNGSVSITVYDYVDNAAQWQYEYGFNVSPRISLAPSGAVADIDGDGNYEVAISVFDNQDEVGTSDGINRPNQWSTAIYDAATGAVVADLPNHQVVGYFDIDQDGKPELMTRTTRSGFLAVPTVGTLHFWGLTGARAPVSLYQIADATPITATADRAPEFTSRDNNRVPAPFATAEGQLPALLVARGADEDGEVTVELVRAANGQIETLASTTFDGANDVQLAANCSGLLETPHVILRDTLGTFSLYDTDLAPQQRLRLAGHFSETVLVPLDDAAARNVIFRDATNNIVALEAATADRLTPPTELWRYSANVASDFIALDVDGDGDFEVAISGRAQDDTPFLALVDGDGQELWRMDMPTADTPLFALVDGQFGGDASRDLVGLTFVGGSPQTWSVDGATGARIATHVADINEVNATPNRDLLVRADQNNDGFDDLVLLHYTTFERLNGADLTREGAVAALPPNNSRATNSSLFPGQSGDQIFLKAFLNNIITMGADGTTTWQTPLPLSLLRTDGVYAGFADADGDELLDIAIPGSLSDLTVLNGLTGEVLYRLCLEDGAVRNLTEAATPESCVPTSPLSSVAVADIDGDGEDEFLVGGAGGWLYSLSVGDGASEWAVEVQSQIFYPAVADIDGDGSLEIAVTSARSELSVIDNAALPRSAEVRDVGLDEADAITDAATDIDSTTRSDALAVAWEPVVGASNYLVQIVTANNTEIVPNTDVGDVTQVVFTGLTLIPGTLYRANVIAVSQTLGASPVAGSDGVRVLGGDPSISDFQADPSSFSPEGLETTDLTALVEANGVILINEIVLTIRNEMDQVVRSETFTPALTNFQVMFSWDGSDDMGQTVPEGTYTASIEVTDALGGTASADGVMIQTVAAGLPQISGFTIAPMAFASELGQSTDISAQLQAYGNLDLDTVTVQITDSEGAVWLSSEQSPMDNSAQVALSWDGSFEGNSAPVGSYTVTVVASDELGQMSMVTGQVEIVEPAPPTITDLVATPEAIVPAAGETSVISADITAFEGVTLSLVGLVITDGEGVEVFTSSEEPDAAAYALNLTWDGSQDGAALPAGAYTATVTATDSQGRSSSDQVVVTLGLPAPPMISNLAAMPDPFQASNGETTQITADVAAFEGISLASVTVDITNEANEGVFNFTVEALAAADYSLELTWDGMQDGAALPAGAYTVTVTATDSLEQTSEANTTVNISNPMPPTLTDFAVSPDTISPDDGESAQITGALEAFGGLTLEEVVVVITSQGEVEWFRQVLTPGTATFALDVSWNGRNEAGDLALEGPYTVTVAAVDSLGQAVGAMGTVNVVTPEPPLIADLGADPEVINVSQGQSTLITAAVSSRSSTPLTRVRVKVRNASTFAVIRDWVFDADSDTFNVEVTWDGRFGNGNPVSNGDYDVNVEATDGNNRRSDMSTTVTVTSDMTEEDMDMGVDMEDPDMVDPDMDNDMEVDPDMVDPDMIDPDMEDPDMVEPDMDPDMVDPDMEDPDMVEPDVVEPDMDEDMVEPDVVEPDMGDPDVVEPDMAEPDMADPDMGGQEDMGMSDTGGETPDVQGGGGTDDCSCSTPAAPATTPSAFWLLGALGGVILLRRRR